MGTVPTRLTITAAVMLAKRAYLNPKGKIVLWDPKTKEELSSYAPVPSGAVTALAFSSPDGNKLAFWTAHFVTHDSMRAAPVGLGPETGTVKPPPGTHGQRLFSRLLPGRRDRGFRRR